MGGICILLIFAGWSSYPSQAAATTGHSLQAVDCTSPAEVQQLDLLKSCEKVQQRALIKEKWLLVQQTAVETRSGWKCQVQVSRWHYLCGVWGHLKSLSVPEILHPLEISGERCRRMLETRQFHPRAGNSFALKLGRVTRAQVQELGVLQAGNNKI